MPNGDLLFFFFWDKKVFCCLQFAYRSPRAVLFISEMPRVVVMVLDGREDLRGTNDGVQ